MSTFEILLVIYGAVLAAAALGVVYRMVVGPTILDRAISSDSLVTLVVMGIALYAAHSQANWAGPALLGLTGLAFIGTVTFARFVAREDPMQGRQSRYASEPSTDTGPHEAIHADPSSADVQDEAPDTTPENTFLPAEAHDPSLAEDPLTIQDPLEDPQHPGEPLESPRQPAEDAGDARQPAADAGEPRRPAAFEFGDEDGFGAQPGSRGFEDEQHRPPDHGTTEDPR